MDLFVYIIFTLTPLLIVSAIVLFVIKRLQYKYQQGTLGKKSSKNAQMLLDSLIPLGMVIGTALSVILSLFIQMSLATISLGSGFGFLFGYFAYEWYSRKEEAAS